MTAVPNTNTFSLQDVYNSVHGHTSGTTGDLQSCFNNAVSYFFDPNYNQDSYAPANSQLRFRNYYPYSVTNYLYAVILNNAADASKIAKSPVYWFTSSSGFWNYTDQVLLATNPSYFYSFNLSSESLASPKRGDIVDIMVQKVTDSPTVKAFDPTKGHRLRYLISQTQYTSAQLAIILANSIELIATEVLVYQTTFWKSPFDFNLSLIQNNYIYMIWDYRE